MKQKKLNVLAILLACTFLVTACKKENDSAEKLSADAEIATHYDDESMVSQEIDAIASETNSLIEADPALSGNASVLDEVICDASVVANFESDPMSVTITFNGTDCGIKRTRTGVMVLTMAKGTLWKNAGATIMVNFQNLKITRKMDGKSITLNGTKTYTNLSGGLVHQAASAGTIIHTIASGDLNIKFDDGTARVWNVARKKVFTYDGGLVITVHGMHEDGEIDGIAEWGTNRFGNSFSTSIEQPLVVKQACDFRLTGGEITHKTEVFSVTATFGLDASGTPTTCPGTGKYYYKLGWTRNTNGNTFTLLLPY